MRKLNMLCVVLLLSMLAAPVLAVEDNVSDGSLHKGNARDFEKKLDPDTKGFSDYLADLIAWLVRYGFLLGLGVVALKIILSAIKDNSDDLALAMGKLVGLAGAGFLYLMLLSFIDGMFK